MRLTRVEGEHFAITSLRVAVISNAFNGWMKEVGAVVFRPLQPSGLDSGEYHQVKVFRASTISEKQTVCAAQRTASHGPTQEHLELYVDSQPELSHHWLHCKMACDIPTIKTHIAQNRLNHLMNVANIPQQSVRPISGQCFRANTGNLKRLENTDLEYVFIQ